jgi:hypothetical protein
MVSRSDYKSKLYHAMGRMITGNKHGRRYTSFQYSLARKYHALGNTLLQTGKKMNLSPEERARRSEALKKARTHRKYSPLSSEIKSNISKARTGQPAHNKDKPAEKFTCPHCQKLVGGANNFVRWHGPNCKSITNGA